MKIYKYTIHFPDLNVYFEDNKRHVIAAVKYLRKLVYDNMSVALFLIEKGYKLEEIEGELGRWQFPMGNARRYVEDYMEVRGIKG